MLQVWSYLTSPHCQSIRLFTYLDSVIKHSSMLYSQITLIIYLITRESFVVYRLE